MELKSYLVKSASSKVMQVMQKEPEEQTAVAVIQRGLVDMMQRLMERVEQLEMTSQKNPVPWVQPSKQPLRRNQANQAGPVVCYCCGQPGQFARGFAQPRQTAPQETLKNNNPVELNAPPILTMPDWTKLFILHNNVAALFRAPCQHCWCSIIANFKEATTYIASLCKQEQ